MNNAKTLSALMIGLFVIFSIGLVSAQVVIAGTVYDGNVSNPVNGVNVTATCDGATSSYISESDGAYAIVFSSVNYCNTHTVTPATNSATVIYLPDGAPTSSSSSGGGGGGSGYCSTEWTCSEWSACSGSVQTRTCSYPANRCKPENGKPSEMQSCALQEPAGNTTIEGNEEDNKGTSFLTGAVTGIGNFLKTGLGLGVLIGLLIIGGSVIFFTAKKKGKKEDKE